MKWFLYARMSIVYNLLFPILGIFYLLSLAFSSRRGLLKSLPQEIRERLGFYPPRLLQEIFRHKPLWFHAASVGEVKILPALLPHFKHRKILVTTSSKIGKDQASKLPGVDWALIAPLDFYPIVSRAIKKIHPTVLILIETELWPNLISGCIALGAKVFVVNGRISDRSFPRYLWAKRLLQIPLSQMQFLCVQTESDQRKFVELGAQPSRVRVLGNMKLDAMGIRQELEKLQRDTVFPKLKTLGWTEEDILFVAGSTHAEEEQILLELFQELKSQVKNLRLILAPRHVERCSSVLRLLQSQQISTVAWSDENTPFSPDCLLIDVIGPLAAIYHFSSIVFVGGTLVNKGGHNLLEPAFSAKPILFGPYTQNTQAVAQLLEKSGGGFRVQDKEHLKRSCLRLIQDPTLRKKAGDKAQQAARSLQGAAERTANLLKTYI
ncbi:MAG: 3-deoxy-D-manno-octulosonic acid transferase [Elusimicrobia bacterium]|nr:3-deoxy-D-manno-octulosonic acid transferase [Elusimicrobiota bacterium]